MFNPIYVNQVRLLLSVLPLIQKHGCFALKGGTAMNLFIQDLPRLSVDIDLVYLPLVSRAQALSEISQYAGRLHRLHDDKSEVRIYDYVDQGTPILGRMFERRVKGYEVLGYKLPSPEALLL